MTTPTEETRGVEGKENNDLASQSQPVSGAVGQAVRPGKMIACLRAAKRYGLIRKNGDNLSCPSSGTPGLGWWALAMSSDHRADASQGGPWSVEFVAELCELGLLGRKPDQGHRAWITKAGKALIAPRKSRTQDAAGGDSRPDGQEQG